jgi:hypothetical protein
VATAVDVRTQVSPLDSFSVVDWLRPVYYEGRYGDIAPGDSATITNRHIVKFAEVDKETHAKFKVDILSNLFPCWSDTFSIIFERTAISSDNQGIPSRYKLCRNYPNPFNPTTAIEYAMPRNSEVVIKIFDLLGREVRTLVTGKHNAGNHQITWNGLDNTGSPVASGVYFYQMTAEGFSETRKLLLIK